MKNKNIMLVSGGAIALSTLGLATQAGATYITFQSGAVVPTTEGKKAASDSVEQGLVSAFAILGFLSILAMAYGGRFVLDFIKGLPGLVFGGAKK